MPGDVQKLDWIPPWPYPEAHLDGPRTAVLWAWHPENRQIIIIIIIIIIIMYISE